MKVRLSDLMHFLSISMVNKTQIGRQL
ncbi:hypothetical protein MPC1_280010 [Methylocella tundrae]|nr:hypothetical protein MPC1_280010 [Methylocella tundrae]